MGDTRIVSKGSGVVRGEFYIGEKVKIVKTGIMMVNAKVGGTARVTGLKDREGDYPVIYEANSGSFVDGWAEEGDIEHLTKLEGSE